MFFSHRLFCTSRRVSFDAEENDDADGNELLVELEGKDEKRERETDMWFSKVRIFTLVHSPWFPIRSVLIVVYSERLRRESFRS